MESGYSIVKSPPGQEREGGAEGRRGEGLAISGPKSRTVPRRDGSLFGSCRAALSRARAVLEAKSSAELACVELRDALYALGELTGDVMTEDVMDVVFERFCVGK